MSIKDKFKTFIGLPEDEEFEEETNDATGVFQGGEDFSSSYTSEKRSSGNNVVNIHATTQLKVVLVSPTRFEEATTVADHLNQKRTVVLNLEGAGPEESRRLIDFLCGAAYANDGTMKKVAKKTYIITPCNVDVMGDLLDELENSGVIFE